MEKVIYLQIKRVERGLVIDEPVNDLNLVSLRAESSEESVPDNENSSVVHVEAVFVATCKTKYINSNTSFKFAFNGGGLCPVVDVRHDDDEDDTKNTDSQLLAVGVVIGSGWE